MSLNRILQEEQAKKMWRTYCQLLQEYYTTAVVDAKGGTTSYYV